MEQQTFKVNFYGTEHEVTPNFVLYNVSDFMGKKLTIPGIQLFDESQDDFTPFATITKSFGEFIGFKNAAYIDTNNCPFAEQMLRDSGIAQPTGLTMHSGFCEYPLWVFDEAFLRAIGGDLYQAYSDEYDKYMESFCTEEDEDPDEGEHLFDSPIM